jgi:apolipoprotein N-acyltransferase
MSVLKPLLGDAMINLGGAVVSLGYDEKRTVFSNPYNAGKMAPIICYESIYGEFVADYVREGANFLGIMTNDSWWGHTQGHEQLLSYARLRAIENRREIARAANSGISAHIDARGEIISDTLYDDETTLPADINLYKEQTVYTRSGDMLSKICIFAFGFIIFYGMVQWLQEKTKKERKKIVIKR